MKTRAEVSADKLRGGFYTPPDLVGVALRRLASHLGGAADLRILEPSAGEGAFVRGLADSDHFRGRIQQVTAVELLSSAVEVCRREVSVSALSSRVIGADFLEWQESTREAFDAAVGNPPFVRFQFMSNEAKRRAATLAESLGLPRHGVSNLWIPVLLGALSKLRPGGAFAFVIPSECFTGISAGGARTWLIRSCSGLTFDLFRPGSFPGVLQEVIVLSGRRSIEEGQEHGEVLIVDQSDESRSWKHEVSASSQSWTKYLLRPMELERLQEARGLPYARPLAETAKFEVAAVTGANDYFSVHGSTIGRYGLDDWARPLLPRIRYAPGLVYSEQDHREMACRGAKTDLLDFAADRPDPERRAGARQYIAEGELAGLHTRYKTRIREPWYRIPLVRSEPLLLSKRAHWHPRVVVNEVGAVTTDTIYRGWITDKELTVQDFAAGFHNSLTLLTAELEGRSFGGGVLELVPSEIARLTVPFLPGFGIELQGLDRTLRESPQYGYESPLIEETNALLVKADVGLTTDLMEALEEARRRLAKRRLDRATQSSVKVINDTDGQISQESLPLAEQ